MAQPAAVYRKAGVRFPVSPPVELFNRLCYSLYGVARIVVAEKLIIPGCEPGDKGSIPSFTPI